MWPDPLTGPRDPDKPPPGSEEPGYGRNWWVMSVLLIVFVGGFIALAIWLLPWAGIESVYEEPTPTPTPDWEIDPRMATQLPLVDASDQIHQLWREKQLPNYAGIRLDNHRSTVVLYWKGPLSPEMADLVESLRVNVLIEVADSPYSLSEFQQEAKRLVELDPAATGVNITEAGPLPDCSGLRVAVESAEQLDLAQQVIQSPIRLEFTVAPKSKPL